MSFLHSSAYRRFNLMYVSMQMERTSSKHFLTQTFLQLFGRLRQSFGSGIHILWWLLEERLEDIYWKCSRNSDTRKFKKQTLEIKKGRRKEWYDNERVSYWIKSRYKLTHIYLHWLIVSQAIYVKRTITHLSLFSHCSFESHIVYQNLSWQGKCFCHNIKFVLLLTVVLILIYDKMFDSEWIHLRCHTITTVTVLSIAEPSQISTNDLSTIFADAHLTHSHFLRCQMMNNLCHLRVN